MYLYKIEKRVPFGFLGEWGKVYKLYNSDHFSGEDDSDIIEYQQSNYADIGQDIQVKHQIGTTRKLELSQTVMNLVDKGEYMIRVTTDAYFDTKTQAFRCIVDLGDILYLEGSYWVCDKVEARVIETPKEHQFFQLGLKKIFDKIITGVQNA